MKIIQNGSQLRFQQFDKFHTKLPVGNFTVGADQMGIFLTESHPFTMPAKIYGDVSFSDRVASMYGRLGRGMSVLLSGPKGCGKTVEAKLICLKSKLPVILIKDAFTGGSFASFMEAINQPAVVFIDEFEKVYSDPDDRNFFLSVMDGVSKSQHLFVLTSNDPEIGPYFTNRPGRVRYHKTYETLDQSIVEEVIQDYLRDKNLLPEVMDFFHGFGDVSMDVVTAIVEEVNLSNELPKDFIKFFNAEKSIPERYKGTYTLKKMPRLKDNASEIYAKQYNADPNTLQDLLDNATITINNFISNMLKGYLNYGEMFKKCSQEQMKNVVEFVDYKIDVKTSIIIPDDFILGEDTGSSISLDFYVANSSTFGELYINGENIKHLKYKKNSIKIEGKTGSGIDLVFEGVAYKPNASSWA